MEKYKESYWTICPQCQGRGRKSRRLSKKAKRLYQNALTAFEKNGSEGNAPLPPKRHLDACVTCGGSGLMRTDTPTPMDKERYPRVAIIGGGIGGIAMAVACLHRGIPFDLYERDGGFDERSQGYGLTLQQASKAIEGLGIFELEGGVVSTRHVVHTTEGRVVGEWGIRKWGRSDDRSLPKRTNIHIARQSLRAELLKQLGSEESIRWGHQLVALNEGDNSGVDLTFKVGEKIKTAKADLVVGADGIRSSVRRLVLGEEVSPLRYLGCIVILGICPLENLEGLENKLLDSATVFQTANGNERIYMMPYDADTVMWQLSFPLAEEESKELSSRGAQALKEEACRRCLWHEPIPHILEATEASHISGYPVYDRALLTADLLAKARAVTLIGDAAHPMSPFKGQGANQALLDAMSLARTITTHYGSSEADVEACLRAFEAEMLGRSAVKVRESAEAAEFLHSEIAIHESDEPRGRCRGK
ncbi:FAD-dependent oxidoreductase [Rubritalea spongiae]|uniref:FAD-dependent oxidoreductase n=1 Tax=Rubritalea spongiae TaxID=430797 RepID=A0ABW5E2P6_9BACT